MTDPRHALGARGETRAAALLERAGYRIVARNVRAGGVELDIVARRRGLLVFVEVKTRRGGDADPEEAVDARKRARIARGAAAWLETHRVRARQVRFDVIACRLDDETWQIRHWPGAFDAGD